MTSRRVFFAVLAAASILLSACGSDKTTATGTGLSSLSPSASVSPSGSASSTANGAGKGSGKGTTNGSSPSGSDGGSTGGSTPRRASQSTPPAPGTYTYRQTGTYDNGGQAQEVPERGTLEIEPATAASGGKRSEQTRTLGEGVQMEQVYLFTDNEVLLQEITMQGYSCILRPSLTAVRIPLKVGSTWDDTATCTLQGMTLTITLEAEVLRKETRKVGSTSVPTYVLDIHTETTGTGFEQVQDATTWLSPEHRLAVRTKSRTESTSVYGNGSSEYTEQLVSITPK